MNRTGRVVALALVLVTGPATAAFGAGESPYAGPTEVPRDAMLAASVTMFSIGNSVTQFTLVGGVTPLEQETTKGSQVVVTVSSDVLFEFGSSALSKGAAAEIDRLAARMPRGGSVRVDGYTDAVGTDAYNLDLSRRRAQTVTDQLRRSRPDLKLVASGHGEADPVAPNTLGGKDNPDGRAKNRRVVVTFGR